MSWEVEFFQESNGGQPVRDWFESQPQEVQQKLAAKINLLVEHGPMLDFPHTSQIEGRLREIRTRFGKTRYRILYFFDEKRVGILLHGFTKNTDTVEEADKRIARDRMNEHSEPVRGARKPFNKR